MATAEPVDYVECSACGIRQQTPSISPQRVRFCLGLWPRRPMCERCCTCKSCIHIYRILVETSVYNYLMQMIAIVLYSVVCNIVYRIDSDIRWQVQKQKRKTDYDEKQHHHHHQRHHESRHLH